MVSIAADAPPVMTTRSDDRSKRSSSGFGQHGDDRRRRGRNVSDALVLDRFQRRAAENRSISTARAPAMMVCMSVM